MTYPQIIDYNDAVQDPRSAFSDSELKAGKVAETPLGLPLALSGGFVLTYMVQSGSRKFAVRCFHREVPAVQDKYAAISTRLRSLGSPYFVHFDFQAHGIRVRGRPFPIVKMDWVDGETLGVHLDRVASDRAALTVLRRDFAALAEFLERNGIAHGDVQNDNVIVERGAIRLIDYDGMFVAGMPQGHGTEVGQKNFQHPGRETKHFGPQIDRFSFIVLDISLEALIADPSLHQRFREGGQAIIFKANDFAAPSSSEVFRKLSTMPALRESAKKFAAVCGSPITAVPTLADFVAGRDIPVVTVPLPGAPPKPAPAYIGAFDVVGAKDFDAVMRRVGDKVELVGQIVSVKQGIGRRGRGRGRPYVFINFGIWNKDSVKVTIWSEGLGNMSTRPSDAWVGRWISVTGLVEPPYEGKLYGRPYRNVGVTVISDNQIVQLSERDAQFRLGGHSGRQPQSPSGKPKTPNQAILAKIGGGQPSNTRITRPKPTLKTTNQQILEGIRQTGSRSAPPSPRYTTSSQPNLSGKKGGIPWWVWAIGAVIVLYFIRG